MNLAFEVRDSASEEVRETWRAARVELVQTVATARLLASRPVREHLEMVIEAEMLAQELVDRLRTSSPPESGEWEALNYAYRSARDVLVDHVQGELDLPESTS